MTRLHLDQLPPAMRDQIAAQHGVRKSGKEPRRNKYGARRTKVDGILFDSKKEARRYAELKLMVQAGEIVRFHRQVIFDVLGSTYRCDFMVIHTDGRIEYEDVKGHLTKDFRKIRKQVDMLYGVEIVTV